MKKNQGYTLIELIIVLAIIAILTGMSFVTIAVIRQAQYNSSASTLSNQMGSLLVKTKAVSEAKDDPLCMLLHKYSKTVTLDDGKVIRKGSYALILGRDTSSGFVVKNTNSAFSEDDTSIVVEDVLASIISIKYTSTDDDPFAVSGSNDTDHLIIEFVKSNGSVRYGSGSYEIIYNERTVATVKLDKTTGNHYLK
ncbi:MAG: prepilin-type N-terminal cleavage/methylation domain-containing protein [Lachnospiraceae bacterium]